MKARQFLALAALTLLAAMPALAEKAPPPGRVLPGCGDPKAISRYLGLSDAQKTSWRALRQDFEASVKPIAESIKPLHDQLETLLDTAAPEACAAGGIVVQIDGKQDQIGALHDAYFTEFEKLLTPDQLVKWNALQAVCAARGERGDEG